MRITLLLSSLFLLFSSCEESRTGCLDFYAENYDVGAVSACEMCCSYPSVSFVPNLVFDTLIFAYNRYTKLPSGDSIAIQEFKLGVVGVKFFSSDSSYSVINSANPLLRDNVVLYNSRSSGNLVLGETSFSADLSSLRLDLGGSIDSLHNLNDVSEGSNWEIILDSLFVDSTGVLNTFNMTYLLNDSIPHSISSDKLINNLNFSFVKLVVPGMDWSLDLTMDFNVLLDGINGSQTELEVKTQIEDNLSSFINIE